MCFFFEREKKKMAVSMVARGCLTRAGRLLYGGMPTRPSDAGRVYVCATAFVWPPCDQILFSCKVLTHRRLD